MIAISPCVFNSPSNQGEDCHTHDGDSNVEHLYCIWREKKRSMCDAERNVYAQGGLGVVCKLCVKYCELGKRNDPDCNDVCWGYAPNTPNFAEMGLCMCGLCMCGVCTCVYVRAGCGWIGCVDIKVGILNLAVVGDETP